MSSIGPVRRCRPYSSTTSARWMREACICASRSIARIDGGTYSSLRMMSASASGSERIDSAQVETCRERFFAPRLAGLADARFGGHEGDQSRGL